MSKPCINLFPEQLIQIAKMCEALNAGFEAETSVTNGMGVEFTYGIPIQLEGGDGHVGRIVDEVGGSWSFQPEPPDTDYRSIK